MMRKNTMFRKYIPSLLLFLLFERTMVLNHILRVSPVRTLKAELEIFHHEKLQNVERVSPHPLYCII